jgi:long-subunit fatty acid transport protein
VLASQVLPNFSIGAGLTINYGAVNLRSGLVWPTQPHDLFRFKGYNWDVGYNLGAIYSEGAVPDAHYSPLVGDEARHWLSVGTEYKCGRTVSPWPINLDLPPDHMVSGSAPSAIG